MEFFGNFMPVGHLIMILYKHFKISIYIYWLFLPAIDPRLFFTPSTPPPPPLAFFTQLDSLSFYDFISEYKYIYNLYVYKLYDKRDSFNFFIVQMPQMSSNIPSAIFYGSVLSEFLRIARCTLLFEDFIPKANQLFHRMISQGGDKTSICKQIRKACLHHSTAFLKSNKLSEEIIIDVTAGQ